MDAVITTIPMDQQDSFGQYVIPPGHIHVFPFEISMFSSVTLEMTHIFPNSQDFSIVAWITEKPLDGLVLNQQVGHFKLIRRQTVFEIHDAFLKQEDDDRLFLQSGRTYYVNVKNLQNRQNAYELFLDPAVTPAPPPP